jgi:hypothetical protein
MLEYLPAVVAGIFKGSISIWYHERYHETAIFNIPENSHFITH